MKMIQMLLLLLLPYSIMAADAQRKTGRATIVVSLKDVHQSDTLMLMYYDHPLNNVPSQSGSYHEQIAQKKDDGYYHFSFDITATTGYFFIGRKINSSDDILRSIPSLRFKQLTGMLFAEAGDSVKIHMKSESTGTGLMACDFTGTGSLKYTIRETIFQEMGRDKGGSAPFDSLNNYVPGNSYEIAIRDALSRLELSKGRLSSFAYQLLKADIIYHHFGLDGVVEWNFRRKISKYPLDEQEKLRSNFRKQYPLIKRNEDYGIDDGILEISKNYTPYVLLLYKCDTEVFNFPTDSIFCKIVKNFTGSIRGKILSQYFIKADYPSNPKFLERAIDLTDSPFYRKFIEELANSKKYLDIFKYSLTSDDGKKVKLADYKGKTIFLDFWFTGCAKCSEFYRSTLSKVEKTFAGNKKVAFLTISIDRDEALWLKSVGANKYTSKLAKNFYTDGQGTNHKIINDLKITGYPSMYLISKDGKIISSDASELFDDVKLSSLIEQDLKL